MSLPAIPLEDAFNDILGKAMRGRRLGPKQLAEQAGLDARVIARLLDGEFDEAAIRTLAPMLELGTEALVASGRQAYSPVQAAPPGLACFNTPYHDFFVNAFLVWDPQTREAAAFDTGTDLTPLRAAIAAHGLTLKLIAITHTHPDHIACLAILQQESSAPAVVSAREPLAGVTPIEPGWSWQLGGLAIAAHRTSGHSVGGLTYVVSGLAVPLAIVGDAMFAGSMGGGLVSYEDALANNRREILTLPDETVICPGHGPLTTVGLEKRHNPFFPEFNQGSKGLAS